MTRYSFVQAMEAQVQKTLDEMSEAGWQLMQMDMPRNIIEPYRMLFKRETHG
jgi:hypothetical protein